jgi:hypothetical protein
LHRLLQDGVTAEEAQRIQALLLNPQSARLTREVARFVRLLRWTGDDASKQHLRLISERLPSKRGGDAARQALQQIDSGTHRQDFEPYAPPEQLAEAPAAQPGPVSQPPAVASREPQATSPVPQPAEPHRKYNLPRPKAQKARPATRILQNAAAPPPDEAVASYGQTTAFRHAGPVNALVFKG